MRPRTPAWTLGAFAFAAALAYSMAGSVADVYEECGKTMGCFGTKGRVCDTKCLSSRDCDGLVAFRGAGDRTHVNFTLVGRVVEDMRYVALGISTDGRMGHDGVVECVREGQTVSTYGSFNFDKNMGNQRMHEDKQNVITREYGVFEDGVIKCAFMLPAKFSIEAMNFQLDSHIYHVLVAVGKATKDNVQFHDTAFAGSRRPADLFEVSIPKCPKNKTLLYVHGICMVLAWIFFASSGIITARYFKKTWVGYQLCKKDIWFRIHQGYMATVWALTIIGVLCIFAYEKWKFEYDPHTYIGIVAAALCFIQPFMALLRPGPGAPKRAVFNWVHRGVGVLAHILAVANIFLAFGMDSIAFPVQSYTIVGVFLALYVLTHIILQVQVSVVSDNKGESTQSPTTTADSGMKTDATGSVLRQATWILFLMASAIVTFLLSTLIVERLMLEKSE